ncbi:MAG: 16S rRNA (cytidine(1402)-2'-O)-methyltransferase [Clostridia bacterium]|nr:16S rRNA (cytidine(1402)-2'-O)-methyltransferase [Clostridia bacterium]
MSELYVVATPIGNLGDLTPRAGEAISNADLIAAEDTRVTMKLLNRLGIKKPLVSCHRHNEGTVARGLVEQMLAREMKLCLTCDAGTPAISDPGCELVRLSIEAGIRVIPVCGPSAITAHLSCCGFDCREFAFYGFLPREKKALREKLMSIRRQGMAVAVFYESPHRVVELIKTIAQTIPGCSVSVACDISKLYEKIETGPCEAVLERLMSNANVEKGEYSIAVAIPPEARVKEDSGKTSCEAALFERLLAGENMAGACEKAIEAGFARNEVYRAKLRISRFLEEFEA